MKKLLVFLTAVSLILALGGCAGNNEDKPDEKHLSAVPEEVRALQELHARFRDVRGYARDVLLL